ncbi:hypothetical protein N0V90_001654 [Kalmusia sp. IMI 367209]|nr:hypothetical protein N0V90_001654 [Kalmusia sp. IMI 367209]
MVKKKDQKRRAAKKSANASLREDIERELNRPTYDRPNREVSFISLSFIADLYGSGTPTKLQASLHDDMASVERDGSDLSTNGIKIAELKNFVLKSAPKLYALLILIGQSQRIIQIFLEPHPTTDHIFEQQNARDLHYCSVEYLKSKTYFVDIADALAQKQWLIPPVLCRDATPKFPKHSFRFPFEIDLGEEDGGSSGQVYCVKVANGHLKTDKPNHVRSIALAHKEIEIRDDEAFLMQEVHSIRARRHPNVVEFYASFIAGREYPFQSNEQVDCLHLLFEHADGGNMKSWLTQSTTPRNLTRDFDRGEEVLRCVQDLINAVTFIHSNIEGYTSFHHDIKPSNIVLVTGPPATWKLCDFGMANLKHHQDDSGTRTERYGDIGTYDYRPPEYISEPCHGRSFDVYSLGCIFLELATIWAYGWNDKKLEEFYNLRGNDDKKMYPKTPDHSYHNNPDAVASWFQQLRQKKVDHKCFRQFLDLTTDMVESRPRRVFVWEANMELFEMIEERSETQLKDHFRKIVQPPKTPVNGLDNLHNPLRRASKRGKHWQLNILRDNAWSDEKPQTALLPALSSGQGETFSTLDTCPKNNEYESNDLFGRHDIDKKISKILDQRDCVGLYGTSGVGKSHIAYKYVNRFRKAEILTERRHTFWLETNTEARLRNTILKIAKRVKLTISEMQDPLIAMRKWLSSPSNGSWTMVVDGLDSVSIARLVKELLPKGMGKTLITTNSRDILDELDLCIDESCIQVDTLELEARRRLFQSYNKDVLVTTAEMDDMLKQYELPILIKMVARYLHRTRLPTATWYKALQSGDTIKELEYALKDDPQHLRIFLPLLADTKDQKDYIQYREFPSAPLRLLAELSCLDNCEIDLVLLQQNYKDKSRLWKMLGFLENCSLIGKDKPTGKAGNLHCYFMHESVQHLVHIWVHNSIGRRTLLELYETALCMLFAQYKYEKKVANAGRSTYLLKLPFMPHFERFLQFVQGCKEENPFPGYECSDNMVQSVITFTHVYLDEGRYNDAVSVLDFTRKLYSKEVKFKPQLARLFAKAHILPPLARERKLGWDKAAGFLQVVIQQLADRREHQEERWLCLLELIELYCRSMRPKEAATALSTFQDISLQIDRKTSIPRLKCKRKSYRGPETERELARISIRRRLAEAKVHFSFAKSPGLSLCKREEELRRSRTALEDANKAIEYWFSEDKRWIAEVDESIADVLSEFDDKIPVQDALIIYKRISAPFPTDGTALRADKEKRKWRIDCKIARAQLQLDPESRDAAIRLLNQTIESYETCYGQRDGRHDEHTRACAYLLQDAYTQVGAKEKAQETKIRYHLDLRGSNYVPYPDIEIGNGLCDLVSPLVDHRGIVCLIILFSALVFLYQSY